MNIEDIRRQNLELLIQKKYNGKQANFVSDTGVNQGELSRILGNKRPFGERKARKLEKLAKLPLGSLDQDHSEPVATKHDVAFMRMVPIRGYAKLGEERNHFVDLQYPNGDGCIVFPTKDSEAYAVKCDGDSMAPRIRHGEYAIIEPNTSVTPGDEVLVQSKDGQVMVKVFSHQREGRVYFESINDGEHKPFSIPVEEIDSMQYVAGTAKSALKVEC